MRKLNHVYGQKMGCPEDGSNLESKDRLANFSIITEG